MTQAELARLSGVALRTIRNLELGSTARPRHETVRLLATALGLAEESMEQFARVAAGAPPEPRLDPEAPTRLRGLFGNLALPLIGRDGVLARAHTLLSRSDVRLLTLTGPPGSGKTRLSLELAAQRRGAHRDGVALVSLGPLTAADLVVPAIGQVLGCAEAPNEEPLESVIRCCARRQMLLVLDNFEHVLAAGPDIVELLARCPGLQALVTSRAALRVRLERQLPVPPLEVASPDLERAGHPEELRRVPAIRLFVERAEAVVPDFDLTAGNAPAVAAICRRLDGLPLALELAAPWLQVLSAEDLRDHLDPRLELLVHGPRDLPERQQTLRATLRWSCELLDKAPRALLRRLSVFAGSAAVDAVERVCQAAGTLPGGVLPHLASLVEHSLAQRHDGPDGRPRVALLESVREYAREELQAAGELETTAQAHLDRCADEAARAAREMRGPAEAVWLERLKLEHDNMRAALTWTVDRRRTEAGLRLAVSLWLLWGIGGHQREGLLWFERLLASADGVDADVRADAAHIAGFLAMQVGELSLAIARHRQALDLLQATGGDRRGMARALRGLAQALARSGQYAEAIPLLEQSVAAFSDLGDEPLLALSLLDLGVAVSHEGDSRRSMALYEQALVIQRRLGNTQRAALCLVNLGNQAMLDGDLAQARARLTEAAAIARSGNWPFMVGLTAATFGDLAMGEGDRAEALAGYRAALTVLARIGDRFSAAHCLRGVAQCAWLEGRAARAARFLGAAEALSPLSAEMDWQATTTYERVRRATKEHLGPERFAAAYESGGRLSLDEAAVEAMTDERGSAADAGGRDLRSPAHSRE